MYHSERVMASVFFSAPLGEGFLKAYNTHLYICNKPELSQNPSQLGVKSGRARFMGL